METKICTACTSELPATNKYFYKSANGKGGLRSDCVKCCRSKLKTKRDEALRNREVTASARWRQNNPEKYEQTLIKMYAKRNGLDPNEVLSYYLAHGGKCDICGKPERGRKTRLSIEHDHTTGAFRGLVCGRCNTMIGMADDDISILEAAIEYLKVGGRHDHQ